MLDDREIVAYKKIGKLIFLLYILEQVYYLRLYRHVECGYRLVAHDEFGIERHCARNAYTLTLTAGKLVGIAILMERLQSAVVHDLIDIIVELFLRDEVVLAHRLADYLSTGIRGDRLENGSWKMICIFVRIFLISAAEKS